MSILRAHLRKCTSCIACMRRDGVAYRGDNSVDRESVLFYNTD